MTEEVGAALGSAGQGFHTVVLGSRAIPTRGGYMSSPMPSACSLASHAGQCCCSLSLREGLQGVQIIMQRCLKNCDSPFAQAHQRSRQKSELSLLRCPPLTLPLSRDTRSPRHGRALDGWHPLAAQHAPRAGGSSSAVS